MIFVVGTGRSGTTTVARLLETRFGIDMGGPSSISEAQPDGDWEEEFVRRLNWQFINNEINHTEWRRVVLEWAETKVEPWGVKHPGFSLMMPILLEAFPTATIIWCKRDVEASIESWLRVKEVPAGTQEEDVRISMHYRHWHVAHILQILRRPHLQIDFTTRLPEDQIAMALGEYLELEEKG